jgi:hypothetical protein
VKTLYKIKNRIIYSTLKNKIKGQPPPTDPPTNQTIVRPKVAKVVKNKFLGKYLIKIIEFSVGDPGVPPFPHGLPTGGTIYQNLIILKIIKILKLINKPLFWQVGCDKTQNC